MKPIKDTKLGQWLKEKAPKVLDKVGDLLPDNGVLGVIKNLIDSEPDITPEERKIAATHAHELELESLKDKQNARSREVDFLKATGHTDYLMWVLAISAICIFAYMVIMVMNGKLQESNENLIFHIFGIIEGVVLSIFGYYFGSSASSRIKDMIRK